MHLFCQLSNLLGIFPVAYCLSYRAYGLAAVVAAAVLLSVIYHVNEKNWLALLADTVGVSLLVAAGVTVIKNSNYIMTLSNVLTIVYASAGLTCFILAGDDTDSEEYKIYHTGWHIFSIYGVGTFLYSYFNSTYECEESSSKILCKNLVTKKKLKVRVSRRRKTISNPWWRGWRVRKLIEPELAEGSAQT